MPFPLGNETQNKIAAPFMILLQFEKCRSLDGFIQMKTNSDKKFKIEG